MLHEVVSCQPVLLESPAFQVVRRELVVEGERSHVLVPTAMTPRDRQAVRLGLQMAVARKAQVTLLHVLPLPEPATRVAEPAPSMHWLDAIDNLHQALAPANRARLQDQLQILDGARGRVAAYLEREIPIQERSHTNVRVECTFGEVAGEIVRFAAAESVDLLILSSELSQWRLRVVPTRVHNILRQVQSPVIVVRPGKNDAAPREPVIAAS